MRLVSDNKTTLPAPWQLGLQSLSDTGSRTSFQSDLDPILVIGGGWLILWGSSPISGALMLTHRHSSFVERREVGERATDFSLIAARRTGTRCGIAGLLDC